jgi:serine protease Do
MQAVIHCLLRLSCVLAVAALPLRPSAAELPPGPAAAPDLAAQAARQFDAVVSISVPTHGPDALTDEELDGLGFTVLELQHGKPRAERAQRLSTSGLASGFIIASDGYIITNAHVVADTPVAVVRLRDGRPYDARVVGLDKRSDIALLKIDAVGLSVARIGSSTELQAGEWVFAVGSPLGLEGTVTVGVVSAPHRVLSNGPGVALIQTDVALNPGSSGGPLFNRHGEVIGVNTMIYSLNGGFMGISLAVPIHIAIGVAAELRASGRVRRGELGAQIQQLTHELALSFGLARATGALVTRVQPRSAAARAGLRSGDIVLGIDEHRDSSFESLQQEVSKAAAGTRLNLNVWRAGAVTRVPVTVRETRPDLPAQLSAVERRAPRLGLQLSELSEQRRRASGLDGGLSVVRSRAAAARGGVLQYDTIVAVGGAPVKSLSEFDAAIAPFVHAERPLALLILRDGQFRYLAVWPLH